MTTIRGKYRSKGYGKGGLFLRMQVPEVAKTFPEILEIGYYGTVNVQLERPLLVLDSDCRVPLGSREVIDLVCVQFRVKEKPYSGWLWVAKTSPLRETPDVHEFVFREKIDVQDGDECSVDLARERVVFLDGVVKGRPGIWIVRSGHLGLTPG